MNEFQLNYLVAEPMSIFFKEHNIDTIIINGIKYKRVDDAKEYETDSVYQWLPHDKSIRFR